MEGSLTDEGAFDGGSVKVDSGLTLGRGLRVGLIDEYLVGILVEAVRRDKGERERIAGIMCSAGLPGDREALPEVDEG